MLLKTMNSELVLNFSDPVSKCYKILNCCSLDVTPVSVSRFAAFAPLVCQFKVMSLIIAQLPYCNTPSEKKCNGETEKLLYKD